MVYVAAELEGRYPEVFQALQQHTPVGLIQGAADVWARDYMPVPVGPGRCVQFVFDPRYLKEPKYQRLRTDTHTLTNPAGLQITPCALVLDGGNVVKDDTYAILTEEVVRANPGYGLESIKAELARILAVKKVVLIPWQPYDWTHHADGMVALFDGKLFVQDFSRESQSFQKRFATSLDVISYSRIHLPSPPEGAKGAVGCYANLIAVDSRTLLVPVYGIANDGVVLRLLHRELPGWQIVPIPCGAPALDGGSLRCLTWQPEFQPQV
ncbi:MAG: agmatine deiminase family protein [Bacteroidia bacterium]|nr:agmatine deiminase family protein [Bacteroidia bacterium]